MEMRIKLYRILLIEIKQHIAVCFFFNVEKNYIKLLSQAQYIAVP